MNTSLTKQTVRAISAEMMTALKSIETKYNVKFNYKGGRYTDNACNFKVEAVVKTADGNPFNVERDNFNRFAGVYNLKTTYLDQTFKAGVKSYKVVGLAPRKHKYPVIALGEDGRRYKFAAATVRLAIG